MIFPEVPIKPGEAIDLASQRLRDTFEAAGIATLPFTHLNSLLPTSAVCHFFQVECEGRGCVVVVMTGAWEEQIVIAILNILLQLRMDPDPPGPPPSFRFYCAEPVPPVLLGLFGDSPACDFECRAAPVARFGNEVGPGNAFQFAAIGVHLLRECFGLKVSLDSEDCEAAIGKALTEGFDSRLFPEGGSPLNSLIVLGFLYGENLRLRLTCPSRWARLKDSGPWPVLIFGAGRTEAVPGTAAAPGTPQVVFSPIATVANVYSESAPHLLEATTRTLFQKLRETVGTP